MKKIIWYDAVLCQSSVIETYTGSEFDGQLKQIPH